MKGYSGVTWSYSHRPVRVKGSNLWFEDETVVRWCGDVVAVVREFTLREIDLPEVGTIEEAFEEFRLWELRKLL